MEAPREGYPPPAPRSPGELSGGGSLHFFGQADPFDPDVTVEAEWPAGGTLAELLEAAPLDVDARYLYVTVDGRPVPPIEWGEVRPCDGAHVEARLVPGATAAFVLLSIASALSFAGTGLTVGFGVAGALGLGFSAGGIALASGISILTSVTLIGAISFGLSLATQALAPEPDQNKLGAFDRADSPTIRGTRNQLRPFEPVPNIYGRHRLTPALGAKPFTEIIGGDQYLNLLFVVGFGRCKLSELRIGETSLASINSQATGVQSVGGSAFDSVEVEVREGVSGEPALSSYPNQVTTLGLNVVLHTGEFGSPLGPSTIRTTEPDTDSAVLDFVLPEGLASIADDGDRGFINVGLDVDVRETGTSTWQNAQLKGPFPPGFGSEGTGRFVLFGREVGRMLRGVRVELPSRGQWDVRVSPFVGELGSGDNKALFKLLWQQLKSIRRDEPIDPPVPMARVAMRIKATDQLQGTVDQFNLIAERYLPEIQDDGDGTFSLTASKLTRLAAPAYLDKLTGSSIRRPAPLARVDLAALYAWQEWERAAGRTFDAVFDFSGTTRQKLQDIAGAGRAAFTVRDGLYSVVQDVDRSGETSRMQVNPRVILKGSYKGAKPMADRPDAVKATFLNADEDYRRDEMIVPFPGTSLGAATRFDRMEVFGRTGPALVEKDVRWRMRMEALRAERHACAVALRNLLATRGDAVKFGHEAALIGLAWGRVLQFTAAGSTTGGPELLLDAKTPTATDTGTAHGVAIEFSDGEADRVDVDAAGTDALRTALGDERWIALSSHPQDAAGDPKEPEPDDLVSFGESTEEALDAIVKVVRPNARLRADLELVYAANEGHAVDGDPLLGHTPQITPPPDATPPAPRITEVRQLQGVAEVRFEVPRKAGVTVESVRAQFRQVAPESGWFEGQGQPRPEDGSIRIGPLVEGVGYEVRLQAVSAVAIGSPFSAAKAFKFRGLPNFARSFPVQRLELTNGVTETEFRGKVPEFAWEIGQPPAERFDVLEETAEQLGLDTDRPLPFLDAFRVRVLDEGGTEVARRFVKDRAFVYDVERQVADGGRRRKGSLAVAFVDVNGFAGPEAVTPWENPRAPEPASFALTASPGGGGGGAEDQASVWIEVTPGAANRDPDFRGFAVWASKSSGFTPEPENLKAVSSSTRLVFDAEPNATWYVRVAAFDEYAGEPEKIADPLTALNLTPEKSITPATSALDIPIGNDVKVSGQVDSATASTLTDTGAFAGLNLVGANVLAESGDGEGQARKVASHTDDQLTLQSDWREDEIPQAGDDYAVYTPAFQDGVLDSLMVRNLTIERLQIANDSAAKLTEIEETSEQTIFDGTETPTFETWTPWATVVTGNVTNVIGGLPVLLLSVFHFFIDSAFSGNLAQQLGLGFTPYLEWRIVRDPGNANGVEAVVMRSKRIPISVIGFVPGFAGARFDLPPAFASPIDLPYSVEVRWKPPVYEEGLLTSVGENSSTLQAHYNGSGTQWAEFSQGSAALGSSNWQIRIDTDGNGSWSSWFGIQGTNTDTQLLGEDDFADLPASVQNATNAPYQIRADPSVGLSIIARALGATGAAGDTGPFLQATEKRL